jgi:hypothetical protein
MVTLLSFSVLGFRRGMAKELIYSGFAIFGFVGISDNIKRAENNNALNVFTIKRLMNGR